MRVAGGRDTWATVAGFVLALGLCLYYQAHAVIDGPLRADAAQYAKLAINLLQHHVLSSADPGSAVMLPESYRTPGYPVILAIIYVIAGQDLQRFYALALTVQALMAALTVVFTFRLGRHFLSFWPAFIASLLLALWPMAITQSGYLLTETAFGCFLMGGLWLACVAHARTRLPLYAASAALLAYAAAINPMIAPFPLALAAVLGLLGNRKAALLFVAFIAIPWAAWHVRNDHLPQASESISQGHRLAENVLIGMSPDIKRYYNDRGSPEGESVFADFHHMLDLHDRQPDAFYAEMWQRVAAQPGKYLHWYFVEKPGDIWFWPVIQGAGGIYVYPNIESPFETNPFYRLTAAISITLSSILLLFAFVAAVQGVVGWLRGRHRSWSLLLLSLLFWYFSLLYWVLTPDGRYVTPFRGVEFLLALRGMVWGATAFRDYRARAAHSLSRDAAGAGMSVPGPNR
ncbi:hypothetical protein [Dyella sp. C11]|uniref:hypothetical protein n=1 Tax=Dyella sp. C11 TaxID=2126991 RepID=UPI0013007CE3|nr:hypothetical protein [Dyella sp. C11]